MRKLRGADLFKEIVRPVTRIWKYANRSDERGNIYVVQRVDTGNETVHVARKSLELRG